MQISGNTVLITGGSTDIGYPMAEYFLKAVYQCFPGRTQSKFSTDERRMVDSKPNL
jgi:short-subunit dehydrogenase involved in D-alanine esterification of teichoic acids